MVKVLLVYKKRMIVAYAPPKKEETMMRLIRQAKEDCDRARDKKGKVAHIVAVLNRNGFKTLDIDELERIKL